MYVIRNPGDSVFLRKLGTYLSGIHGNVTQEIAQRAFKLVASFFPTEKLQMLSSC